MVWPEFLRSGYGLANVAARFGIAYQAHDALEDARCAGMILLRAVAETGLGPEEWVIRAAHPIDLDNHAHNGFHEFPPSAKRSGDPNGDLFGEVLVFTGSLSIPRQEAADAAAAAGCRVDDGVTKHTTMLVVGDQDLRRRAGHEKSSKNMKAERLIAQGQHIRILGESDFMRIVSWTESPSAGNPN